MPEPTEIAGVTRVVHDGKTPEITFDLTMMDGTVITYRASYGAAALMAVRIGRSLGQLREKLQARGAWAPALPEEVQSVAAHQSPLTEEILLEITTAADLPSVFRLTVEGTLAMAEELRSAALRGHPPLGTA